MKISIVLYLLFFTPSFLYSQKVGLRTYSQALLNVDKGIEMVNVPGGTFSMGGSKATSTVKVKVNSFWMSKYEIPWELYELFVYESGDVTKKDKDVIEVDVVTRPSPPYLDMTFGMGKTGFPAVGMTQYNAIQFCKWLYRRTGIFYRLPTEAEWEYACRAGTKTAYFFGENSENLSKYAWYSDNSGGKTQPIGTKEPNPLGIHDLYGNAAEWTGDQFVPDYSKNFSGKLVVDPAVPVTKLYPITVKGGSYMDPATELTSAARSPSDPAWKVMDPQIPKSNWWFPDAPFIGVRIVRPTVAPSKDQIERYYNQKPIPDY